MTPKLQTACGISVRDTGATGTGETDDAAAIQRALDAGAPSVVIPAGHYRIGTTLRVRSNTHLHLHPHAVLKLADGAGVDQSVHLITNARQAEGDANITIEGGIWDGNALHNPRGPDVPGSYSGVMLNFSNVTGLEIRDATWRDPESYFSRFLRVRRFRIEHVRFEVNHRRPNQDGIHLSGFCEDGIIRHVKGVGANTPSDDIVAFNADDANQRAANLGLENGPIRRVLVDDIGADDAHTLVRLLSVVSPIEDITIDNVRGGVRAAAINMDACRQCMVKLFDEADPQFANGVGMLRRVRIRGLFAHKSHGGFNKPLIDFRTLADGVTIERFVRNMQYDACPDAPSLLLAEVPGSRVTLGGLTNTDADALTETSVLGEANLRPETLPFAGQRSRLETALHKGQRLVSHATGFERLHVERAS